MRFCCYCGSPIRQGIPEGDNRIRGICDACGAVHYENPKVIAGCIPVWRERVLLCRRAIEPRRGFWTLPAGFMEQGETLTQAAHREAVEEANIDVDIDGLYTIFNLPHISQVYVFFRARMLSERFFAGYETLEAKLFREHEIPWEELSFETVRRSLCLFFEDRKAGQFQIHLEDVSPDQRRMFSAQSELIS
jgi:ADP-ribose pyrophosphatase YjhB (NUDIX family)